MTEQPTTKTMRDFIIIWGGQAFSLLGSTMVQFALIWYLTRETGSATVLATAALVAFIPQVFLGPFAGALVDRWNRKRVMILADGMIALVTALLMSLFLLGVIQIWHIYALMFLRSLGGAFHRPAMMASTPLMVPDEHLTRIQGLNQMIQGGLNIVGAPLGAILIETVSVESVLMVDIVTAAIAILPLFFVLVPEPERLDESEGGISGFMEEMRSGLRYVMNWPGILMLGAIATIINMVLTPAGTMLPLLVTDVFELGALELGWLDAGFGVGVIIGSVALAAWGGFKKRIMTSILGIIGIGIGHVIIGFVPANGFILALITVVFVGLAIPIANGPLMAIVQSTVRPDMLGRVMSLLTSMAQAMSIVGLVFAGPIADNFGIQTWFVIGGAITLLMAAAAIGLRPVREIETNANQEEAETAIEETAEPATVMP